MNKKIRGDLQRLIAYAEAAQEEEDFQTLEQLVINIADSFHEIIRAVDRVRPEGDNWINRQMSSSSFHMATLHPSSRPVRIIR